MIVGSFGGVSVLGSGALAHGCVTVCFNTVRFQWAVNNGNPGYGLGFDLVFPPPWAGIDLHRAQRRSGRGAEGSVNSSLIGNPALE